MSSILTWSSELWYKNSPSSNKLITLNCFKMMIGSSVSNSLIQPQFFGKVVAETTFCWQRPFQMTTRVPHLSKSVSVSFFPLKIQITSWNKQANHLQLVSPSLFLFAQWSLHCFRSTYQVAITYQGPLAAAQERCFHCQTPVCCRTTIASKTYPL